MNLTGQAAKDMGLYRGMNQVVRLKDGTVQHYYSKKNRGIHFRTLGPNGTWDNPLELLGISQEDFCLNIDGKDHLHLLSCLNSGEILYMKYDGRTWHRQTVSKFDPARYEVKYPLIEIADTHIHLIFAIGTTFNTGLWTLYHYHWDETRWHAAPIAKITAGARISPFAADFTDRTLHLVCRGLSGSKHQVLHFRYHLVHRLWSAPENLTYSDGDCAMPALLTTENTLHVTYLSLKKNDLSVRYKQKPLQSIKTAAEMTLSGPGANCTHPQLLLVQEKLWCLWSQDQSLYGAHSEDKGVTWSAPEVLPFERSEHFYLLNYLTNDPKEQKSFKVHRILGNLDIGLHLPLIQPYLNLPEYMPAQPPPPYEVTSKGDSVLFQFPAGAKSTPASNHAHGLKALELQFMDAHKKLQGFGEDIQQKAADLQTKQAEHGAQLDRLADALMSIQEDLRLLHQELGALQTIANKSLWSRIFQGRAD